MLRIDRNKFLFDKFSFGDLLYADYCDRKTLFEFMVSIKSYVKGRVLDFGCGQKPYEPLFDCTEYIGIDTEDSGHGWEDKSGPDYFYDGKILPFDDGVFDTVLSTQVFEHVRNLDDSMKEIGRVLSPGGVLIVTVPMAEEEHERPYDFRRFTEIGIIDYLERFGFSIVKSGKLNSWRNSMHILKIAQMCYVNRSGNLKKMYKYAVIFLYNLERILFRNIVRDDLLFSNKVYCIARKKDVSMEVMK